MWRDGALVFNLKGIGNDNFDNGIIPIVPPVGNYGFPMGYHISESGSSFRFSVGNSVDTALQCFMRNENGSFGFRRNDADSTQSDMFELMVDGMSFSNPDPVAKALTFCAITSNHAGHERELEARNLIIRHDDSVSCRKNSQGGISVRNWGGDKSYDLLLTDLDTNGSVQFKHESVALKAGVTHEVVPRLAAGGSTTVLILLDRDSDGSVDDTLSLSNQITDLRTSEESLPPERFVLLQNYPNPFNPSTTIRYGLPHRSTVQLTVFNTLGQQVALLQNGEQDAGYHEVKFGGAGQSSGVYFYRIQAGSFTETKKFLMIR